MNCAYLPTEVKKPTFIITYTYLAKSIQKCMSISTMIMTQHKIASEHKYQPMIQLHIIIITILQHI